jgi:hypothetical protein
MPARAPFPTGRPGPLPSRAARRCARLPSVREQFWFWYGYRPGIRTVASQTLR